MARIRTQRSGDLTCVIISGRLSAGDMGRLEHACAPALLSHPIPLELDLRNVTDIDRTAVAVLVQMIQRGARVIGGSPVLPSRN